MWRRVARGVLTGIAGLLPVVVLAVLVREKFDPLIALDDRAIRAATDLTRVHPALRDGLLVVQAVMQPVWPYTVALLLCAWVWVKGLRSRAVWAAVTMLVGWNLGLLVKNVVQRSRPVVSDPVSHAPGYSFPSGHAFNATLATTVVLIMLWPLLGRRARIVGTVAGAVIVAVTCLDRVYLGVHFPSDVVGGVILALALAGASYVGYRGPRQVARQAAQSIERPPR